MEPRPNIPSLAERRREIGRRFF